MPLELRDPSSGSTFQIPDEGLTIGREGGKADFQVKDNGVSKSHCRIYLDGDAWFLEDLGSANGTYLGEDKLAAPTELMPNDIISMSKTRFEVLGPVDGDGGGEEPPPPTPPPAPKAKAPPPRAAAPAAAAKKPSAKPVSAGPAMSAARKPAAASAADAGGDSEPSAEAKGIGYFFIAVPKAIAYYLAAIPLLLVNPVGSIRKSIAEQKAEPMGRMELIAYALPALFVTSFLPAIATGIGLAVAGHFSIMAFIPIGPAIGAVIGAVITGFIWHPVTEWVIRKLKGTSDERSRTNYFLMFMTAQAVLAVPTAVGILLNLVPVPFIGLVGVLLSLVATLAMLFVQYSWLVHFDVMKIVRTIVLVLGALAVVGSLYSGVMAQVVIIRGMGSSGSAGAVGGDVEAQIAAAKAQGEKAMAEAEEAQKKAMEAVGDAQKDANEAVKDAKEKTGKTKEKVEVAEKQKETEPVAAPPSEKPAEKTTVQAPAGGGYPAFASMRDQIEKRIAEDPTLLNRTSGLLDAYRSYEADVAEIDGKWSKKPGPTKVNNHLRDAEIYEKTEKKVREIHGKLK